MHGRALALAIDLGGTKVDAALVGADGAVVAGTRTGRRRVGMPKATTSPRRLSMSPPRRWPRSAQTID